MKTHPVGKKKANEFGLYDMSGNLWEWCFDWYGEYRVVDINNPKGPYNGNFRVLRGGSWINSRLFCMTVNRHDNLPENRSAYFGFRVVMVDD